MSYPKASFLVTLLGVVALCWPIPAPAEEHAGSNPALASLLMIKNDRQAIHGLLHRKGHLEWAAGKVSNALLMQRQDLLLHDVVGRVDGLTLQARRLEAEIAATTNARHLAQLQKELQVVLALRQELQNGFGLNPATPSSPTAAVNPFNIHARVAHKVANARHRPVGSSEADPVTRGR